MISKLEKLQLDFVKALSELISQIQEAKKNAKTQCQKDAIDDLEFTLEELAEDTKNISDNS